MIRGWRRRGKWRRRGRGKIKLSFFNSLYNCLIILFIDHFFFYL